MTTHWHSKSVDEVLGELDASTEGLAGDEARRRLAEHGPNEIRKGREVSPLEILAQQFNDVLVYVLVLAAAFSMAVGLLPGWEPKLTDAVLILLIVFANGLFGFVQDYRAEKAMEALRKLSAPETRVLRDGEKIRIDARDLFTFIVVAEMVVLQLIRSRYRESILSNRWLLLAVASSLALQGLLLYSPLRQPFEVAPLASEDWLWIGAALSGFLGLSASGLELYRSTGSASPGEAR